MGDNFSGDPQVVYNFNKVSATSNYRLKIIALQLLLFVICGHSER